MKYSIIKPVFFYHHLCKILVITITLFPITVGAMYFDSTDKIESRVKPTQLIVKFSQSTNTSISKSVNDNITTGVMAVDQLHKKYGIKNLQSLSRKSITLTEDHPLYNVYLIDINDKVDIDQICKDYQNIDEIEYAIPDYQVELYDIPDDPLYPHQWTLNNTGQGCYHVERIEGDYNDTLAIVYGIPDADIDAEEVFDSPPDVTNQVVVAIVDTGVDWDHPDLEGMIWNNPGEIAGNGFDDDHNGYIDDVVGWDFSSGLIPGTSEDNDPTDEMGHGTHCAGIVASIVNNGIGISGVVPSVKIMGVKCHPALTISTLCNGVIYAADNGADVINMSWGIWFDIPFIQDVMQYARSKGVILVASAGNDGGEQWNYPASYSETICVSATNSDDQITSWSTYSDHVNVSSPGQSILSLRAENTDMYSSGNEPDVHIINDWYYLASGTSMSAPYVVAVAAYIQSVSPGITHDATKEILENTADDIVDPYGLGESYPGWDKFSGYGRINLNDALAAVPSVRAIINSPTEGDVVSGVININGSADGNDFENYTLEFGSGMNPPEWTEVISSSTPITDNTLGTCDLSDLEGLYSVRLTVNDNISQISVFVCDSFIVNISNSTTHDTTSGLIPIFGSIISQDFHYALLEYGNGEAPGSWTIIDTITTMVYNQTILDWYPLELLSNELYTIRLSVFSSEGLVATDSILVFWYSIFDSENGWISVFDSTLGQFANYGDFDNDGQNEIVIGSNIGVHFISMDGTPKTAGMPVFPPGNYCQPIAVGNLDGDDIDDIVAVGIVDDLVLYGFPSSAPPFQFIVQTEFVSHTPYQSENARKLYLKDINNDGLDEIHFSPSWQINYNNPSYYYIFRPDGTPWGGEFPLPPEHIQCFPADLNGDKIDEIYCYNNDTHYLVQFDTMGTIIDSILMEVNGFGSIPSYHYFSAVDVDGDNIHELTMNGLFIDNITYQATWFYMWIIDDGLRILDGWPRFMKADGYFAPTYGRMKFADLNRDGTLEYILQNSNPNFMQICAWNLDGTTFLTGNDSSGNFVNPTNPGGAYDPAVVDLDNDGYPEILFGVSSNALELFLAVRILAYNNQSELLPDFPLYIVTGEESITSLSTVPTVGDINDDGYVDLLYVSNNKLLFANFAGNNFDANNAYQPMWSHNRKLNNTTRLDSDIVLKCGDVNADGYGPNVADLTYFVGYIFLGGLPLPYFNLSDVDSSGDINVADLVYLVNYLFKGGPEPVCN